MNIEPNLNFSHDKKAKIKILLEKLEQTSVYNPFNFTKVINEICKEIGASNIDGNYYYDNSITIVDFKKIHDIVGFISLNKYLID